MKFLGDAHVSRAMVAMLARHGHECSQSSELPAGLPDIGVMQLAVNQSRIVLTHDKDFGNLAFVYQLPIAGVLLLRINGVTELHRIRRLEIVLPQVDLLMPGRFVVVTNLGLRHRKLP